MYFKHGFIDWFMEKVVCPILAIFGVVVFLALLSLIGTLIK